MPRRANVYSDSSGEIIGDMVAGLLFEYEGQTVTDLLVNEVSERVAAMIGLVGLKEAAELLERPGYRLSQLAKANDERMPTPITVLAATPVWLLSDIEKANPLPDYKPAQQNKLYKRRTR